MTGWTPAEIESQAGRTAVVTGANSGLGFHVSSHLANAGGRVIMACRNDEKATAAAESIREGLPAADVVPMTLDLADLDSVEKFSERLRAQREGLDLLINNAGVMALPQRYTTRQGFETQFGTNHLGHFALTGRLLPLLLAGDGARVVTVSSLAHRSGEANFEDPQWQRRRYAPWGAYGQSKLANLLFTLELDRQARARDLPLRAVAAHPGVSATNLAANGPAYGVSRLRAAVTVHGSRLLAQSEKAGTLPVLYAATSPDAVSGGYYGPRGPGEMRGRPATARPSERALDPERARRLWTLSEELTGVDFGELVG